jgi:hypothetical protein
VTALEWFKNVPATPTHAMFVSASLDMSIRLYKDYQQVALLTEHKGIAHWQAALILRLDPLSVIDF